MCKRAAILLYPRVLDTNNFSAVLNAIPFNADREDVLRAIRVKGNRLVVRLFWLRCNRRLRRYWHYNLCSRFGMEKRK